MERREDGSVGRRGSVSGLDRLSQRQGRGGMNINNALCRKIVTMDIIER